jgi:hypothetical protein
MDLLLINLAENLVEAIDDRYGRSAAWIAAIVAIGLFIAIPVGLVWRYVIK